MKALNIFTEIIGRMQDAELRWVATALEKDAAILRNSDEAALQEFKDRFEDALKKTDIPQEKRDILESIAPLLSIEVETEEPADAEAEGDGSQ